jgi:4-hydroxybenzoate polyprenyltransferase
MENILAHYGIDWFAMALSLYAAYLLGNKKKIGFVIFAISNIFWIILGVFFMSSYGMAIGNFAFFLINVRGYVEWNKEDPQPEIVQ